MTAAQMFKQLQDDCLAGRIGSSVEFYARRVAAFRQYEAETRERHEKSHNPKSCFLCQDEARAEQDSSLLTVAVGKKPERVRGIAI